MVVSDIINGHEGVSVSDLASHGLEVKSENGRELLMAMTRQRMSLQRMPIKLMTLQLLHLMYKTSKNCFQSLLVVIEILAQSRDNAMLVN